MEKKRIMQFSSANSSTEKLNVNPRIPGMSPAMSFGGEEDKNKLLGKNKADEMIVREYSNSENQDEFDTFRT